MPTHLGANPRNHVNHDYSFSPLENFYYYDKNINTFVFNIDYLRKVSNDGKIFIIISPEYYYYILLLYLRTKLTLYMII